MREGHEEQLKRLPGYLHYTNDLSTLCKEYTEVLLVFPMRDCGVLFLYPYIQYIV